MTDELAPAETGELTLEMLQDKLNLLEEQLRLQSIELDNLHERIPDSMIISPNFLKRAFTVWGHYVVAGFLVAIPFICLSMIFAVLMALFSQQ